MFCGVAGRPVRSVSKCLSVLILVGETRHAQVRIPSYAVPVFRAILKFQRYVTDPWSRLNKMIISAVLNPC
ncbi:hypothetical protein K439DRAFT_1643288 [Ramaria rubella]|nr:hypothetical protein K439DRAFT_1643288 [Ramaria rubella]